MRTLFAKTLILLLVFGATSLAVRAQDQITAYIITSTPKANARECPRVSCAVVLTFDKGEEVGVSAVVSGDIIAGSNQWLKVSTETGDVYVHSSLAAPDGGAAAATAEATQPAIEATAAPSAAGTPTPQPTVAASQPGWTVFNGGGITLETPGTWTDAADLFSDQDLIDQIAQTYGLDAKEFADSLHQAFSSGLYDAYLLDLATGISLDVSHEDRRGLPMTGILLRGILKKQAEDMGETVVDDQLTVLPAGNAVRLHLHRKITLGTYSAENEVLLYAIIGKEQIYYLEVTIQPVLFNADTEAEADAIASSFRIGTTAPLTGPKT